MAGRSNQDKLFGYERGNILVAKDAFNGSLQPEFRRFARITSAVEERALLANNKVDILVNGDQAYPEMIACINSAKQTVYMCSYIFDTDVIGLMFINALSEAKNRGVEVKLLVDGIGERYSRPTISRSLKKCGIDVVKFNPPSLWPLSINLNLRNHKKILVVDTNIGFTGGMNISDRNITAKQQKHKSLDLHFKLEGPIVVQLAKVLCDDWQFVTKQKLELIETKTEKKGTSYCRCIDDGPSEDLDKLSFILNSLISAAERKITIITPYFLPNREMISNLQSAAIRGIDVNIILPKKSNIRIIDWATRNMLWELLQCRVNIYYQPEPFAHTKLILIDELYAQVGSANLDPRSLRLNFELNMEILDRETATRLVDYSNKIVNQSDKVDLIDIDKRPLFIRARDSFFWLFMHYL